MSCYYTLHCKACDKGVWAVKSGRSGNSCGDYQKTLDFMVQHIGHDLVVLTEDETFIKETGVVEFIA